MRVFTHLLVRTLSRSLAAAGFGLLCTLLLARQALPGAGLEASGAMLLWIHLPAALACIVALAHLVEIWPAFARGRPGGELLVRTLGTRLAGTGSAAAGCLLALGIALLALGVAFPGLASLLGHELPPLRSVVRYRPAGTPLLDAEHPRLCFEALSHEPLTELRLKPVGLVPPDSDATWPKVRILAGPAPGRALHDAALELTGGSEPVRLRLPRQELAQIVLERVQAGGLPLFFGPEAVLGLGADEYDPRLSSLLASLWHLTWATNVAMLLVAVRGLCALHILLLVVLGSTGLLTLVGITPVGEITAALARGRLPAAADQIRGAAPSFSLAVLAMILAWARRVNPKA